METRNPSQIRSHAQKFFIKVKRGLTDENFLEIGLKKVKEDYGGHQFLQRESTPPQVTSATYQKIKTEEMNGKVQTQEIYLKLQRIDARIAQILKLDAKFLKREYYDELIELSQELNLELKSVIDSINQLTLNRTRVI